ncbi:Peptidase aspartic protein [Lasiodiplodia theobromae]|uniref:Peptidase aspartic protein n=1 Tax=Lasiodiplodia theobromae TaxID=45133 RepID=UPI0015C2D8B6|nr:Peptidase aspartic protein [Lasiodiplodia theobromae]KAF4539511.1 Peptidase aspartic protein [Lasiodiplodia theobromae]
MRVRGLQTALRAVSAFAQIHQGYAASNFPVPWSVKYYGPDGPWQAVSVSVGGVNSQATTQVDLYPSGAYGSPIITSEACEPYPDTPCGAGGIWSPTNVEATATSYRQGWIGHADQIEAYGASYIQAMTINGQTVPYVPLVAIDNATITSPSGKKYGPQCGNLALGIGGGVQTQNFPDASSDVDTGFMFLPGLYNQSVIPSYAYGLHYGSATLKYGGSLVFGGYDKGRVLGKYTNYTGSEISLLDIGIGVEKGGSPFESGFKSKSGLLLNSTGHQTSFTVNPNPGIPGLYLPGKTCQEIAKYLPLTFDTSLQYYLWNTDDERYEKIITSPSYLSFTFPWTGDSSSSSNITIKVPFLLLNLTLDAPLVSTPTPYFPCIPIDPTGGDVYRLGRAFLQAAFTGHNFIETHSWLAQAPGPGTARNGLGVDRVDLAAHATAIETNGDPDGAKWAASWEGYWEPLAEDGSQTATPTALSNPETSGEDGGDGGLSTAAKVAVAVVGVVAAALVAGLLVWWRRRKEKRRVEEVREGHRLRSDKCPFGCPHGMHAFQCPFRPPAPPVELWTQPPMLPGTEIMHEMPGSGPLSPRELDAWRKSMASRRSGI